MEQEESSRIFRDRFVLCMDSPQYSSVAKYSTYKQSYFQNGWSFVVNGYWALETDRDVNSI